MMALGVVKPGTPGPQPGDGGRVNPYLFDWIQKFQPEVKAQVDHQPGLVDDDEPAGSRASSTAAARSGPPAHTFEDYDYDAMPDRRQDRHGAGRRPGGQQGRLAVRGLRPDRRPGTAQWAVGAVIEDAGFGAWAAAPVVKCIFAALGDPSRMAPLVQSDPLGQDGDHADLRRRHARTRAA